MKKIKQLTFLSTLIVSLLFSVASCSVSVDVDEAIIIGHNFDDLRSWELMASVSENQIKNLVNQNEPSLAPIIANRQLKELKVYKITYNTLDVDGNNIALVFGDYSAGIGEDSVWRDLISTLPKTLEQV